MMEDGRRINLWVRALINLAAAEGHPASVMDMSFATGYELGIYEELYPVREKVYGGIEIDKQNAL
jgi:S-adenosylhomocysteine hydrolase